MPGQLRPPRGGPNLPAGAVGLTCASSLAGRLKGLALDGRDVPGLWGFLCQGSLRLTGVPACLGGCRPACWLGKMQALGFPGDVPRSVLACLGAQVWRCCCCLHEHQASKPGSLRSPRRSQLEGHQHVGGLPGLACCLEDCACNVLSVCVGTLHCVPMVCLLTQRMPVLLLLLLLPELLS